MKKLVAAAVLCAFVFAPSAAAEGADSDDQKVVCKRQKTLGSNFAAKRVCRTKAQWKELEQHTQRELRDLSGRANNPTPIPGGPR